MSGFARNNSYEGMVKDFHEKYGHLISPEPTTESPQVVKDLRRALIQEEMKELFEAIEHDDIEEIADGGADLIYVVVGTMISYGVPIDRIFREIHLSNMTKTPVRAEGGQKYGTKTPKGPDFEMPDVRGILYYPELATRLEIRDAAKSA